MVVRVRAISRVVEWLCLELKSQQFHRSVTRILQLLLLTNAKPPCLSHLQIDSSLAFWPGGLQFRLSERYEQRRFAFVDWSSVLCGAMTIRVIRICSFSNWTLREFSPGATGSRWNLPRSEF